MFAQQIEFLQLLNRDVEYVVPRWQRRYRWGQAEIERLIEDLLTVAEAGPNAAHYGGTLLTFPEPGPAGVVVTNRVVDGQQRLTTISILLECIAATLGPEGSCGDWTAEVIRERRLTNPGQKKLRKLRLQDGDDEEYRAILGGEPTGVGAVTQAWRIISRLVARNNVAKLLRGLEHLRVVSIGLDANEDPQQIFESLNATGRPLDESEKIKNWLLMGLPEAEQQDLHDTSWLSLEEALGGRDATKPVDEFFRDLLRWWTGRLQGLSSVYETLRRWAVREGRAADRPGLCREFARLARLYGLITGTAGPHPNRKVEHELRHLRAMGIDVHRPLTLRLLEAAHNGEASDETLAEGLAVVSVWITRLWLSGRPTAGLNKAATELAHGPGPSDADEFVAYWRGRVANLGSTTRAGVPDDPAVTEGIQTRQAYGGSASQTTLAVLCALMEAEHPQEAPARADLTIEHVMPQKLTDEWREDLGEAAEDLHARYRDRLPNLTLSGHDRNASLGARPFAAKQQIYGESAIGMTLRLAQESAWNQEALERRAEELAASALSLWPWEGPPVAARQEPRDPAAGIRWRLGDGDWHPASTASQMVLEVAGALIALDRSNGDKLVGGALSRDLQRASDHPPGSQAGSIVFRAVTGTDDFVLYPYDRDYPAAAERCRGMGQRCRVRVDIDLPGQGSQMEFWRFLQRHTGGVPGQKDSWRGRTLWTSALNADGDMVAIYIGNPGLLWLYIRSGSRRRSEARTERMRQYSQLVRQHMGDQTLGTNTSDAGLGMSITVKRAWDRDDRNDGPHVRYGSRSNRRGSPRSSRDCRRPLGMTRQSAHERGHAPVEVHGDREGGLPGTAVGVRRVGSGPALDAASTRHSQR